MGSVDVFSVLLSPFNSAGSPPVPKDVGSVIRPVFQGEHDDVVACLANQVRPGWCEQEGAVTTERTRVSKFCPGFLAGAFMQGKLAHSKFGDNNALDG